MDSNDLHVVDELRKAKKFADAERLLRERWAAAPELTTEMFDRSASSTAYMRVRISASTWLSTGSAGAASRRMVPRCPSMTW